jgi:release factor glutamine methyltransferase
VLGHYRRAVDRLRQAGCVFAEDEARLLLEAAGSAAQLEAMLARRIGGTPLEVVLGWAEFCGLRIGIEPGVFVPRQRTTFLVEQAGRVAPAGGVVVDLCCGSGAIGAALLTADPSLVVHAADIDPTAVRCARRNLQPHGGKAYLGDLFAPLPAELEGCVDVVVANAPYVPSDEIALMPPEAREHEPRPALDGGVDGLVIARRVVAAAAAWLRPGGHLLIETSHRQAAELVSAYAEAGLRGEVRTCEALGATVVTGQLFAETV